MPAHLIDLVGIDCPPELAPQLQAWRDRWHPPDGGLPDSVSGVTHYRFAALGGTSLDDNYPGHLSIYSFANRAAFAAWDDSDWRRAALEDFAALRAAGAEPRWRAQYEVIRRWKNPSPTTLISMTGIRCGPEGAEALDRWYSEKHIPDLLECAEIRGVTRHRLAERQTMEFGPGGPVSVSVYPRFLTTYNFPDLATAQTFDINPRRAPTLTDFRETAARTGAARFWRVRYAPAGHVSPAAKGPAKKADPSPAPC